MPPLGSPEDPLPEQGWGVLNEAENLPLVKSQAERRGQLPAQSLCLKLGDGQWAFGPFPREVAAQGGSPELHELRWGKSPSAEPVARGPNFLGPSEQCSCTLEGEPVTMEQAQDCG